MNQERIEPETSNLVCVQFGIMGPEEIRKRSVVEITKHDTYDKDNPVIKGLFDLRMGTTDMGNVCNTCGPTNTLCPGHFGHITLNYNIIHPQRKEHININKILYFTQAGPEHGGDGSFYVYLRKK